MKDERLEEFNARIDSADELILSAEKALQEAFAIRRERVNARIAYVERMYRP